MNRLERSVLSVVSVGLLAMAMAANAANAAKPTAATVPAATAVAPRPDHVVIVVLENKRYDSVIGDPKTPWVSSLARSSANMLNFHAETHPSQPNYLALFSGSTQGVTDNECPHNLGSRSNLGRQLLDAGYSFAGYSEDLPSVGWRGCSDQGYVRRHNPWVNFANVPASANRPYSDFPNDFRRLPTVSFVIPNLCHDMHDCPKVRGDAWLRKELSGYVAWAKTHNSLFVLTFDEDNGTDHNHIPTIVAGAGVQPGSYGAHLNHYDLLRSIQQMYRLPISGGPSRAKGMPDLWSRR